VYLLVFVVLSHETFVADVGEEEALVDGDVGGILVGGVSGALIGVPFLAYVRIAACRRFDPGGSLDRRVNCRCVFQPRWVGARRRHKGGNRRGETAASCCPAPRADALAVGGYKSSRGRERGGVRPCVIPFSRAATFCTRALDLPFIDIRRGSRCTTGGCSSVLMCLAKRSQSPMYMLTWLSERCWSPVHVASWPSEERLSPVEAQLSGLSDPC
jgi:hypothetical protein